MRTHYWREDDGGIPDPVAALPDTQSYEPSEPPYPLAVTGRPAIHGIPAPFDGVIVGRFDDDPDRFAPAAYLTRGTDAGGAWATAVYTGHLEVAYTGDGFRQLQDRLDGVERRPVPADYVEDLCDLLTR